MTIGRFTVSGGLPGLNDIVGVARSNRFASASQKKKETQRCQWAVISGQVPTYTGPVLIAFKWIEKDLRRDPDNICAGAKFILDALVELGRIPNDNQKWVKGITHEFPPPDKANPRVEITLNDA